MSDTADTPRDEETKGTFVGGSFGQHDDGDADDLDEGRSTAAQIEDEQDDARHLADPAPAAAAEYVTQPSDAGSVPTDVEGTGDTGTVEDVEGVEDTGDVEGTGDEVTPGGRNEPV